MNDMTRRETLKMIGLGLATLATPGLPTPARAAPPTSRPALLTRHIPSSGVALPVIGLGTYQTFDVGTDPFERMPIEAVLNAFVELGGRVIDSSPMYDRAEGVVGDLILKFGLRDKLFVATKVWTQGKAQGAQQMRDSMAKLRADPIDLMQVHNLLDVDQQLATLDEWKQAGRVRHVGVTHYTAAGQRAIVKILQQRPLDTVQINYNVIEREAEDRLLPTARDKGIAVIVNRPFAGGDLLRDLARRPLPGVAKDLACTTWAQLLLKFVVGHPAVTCVIPATSKLDHLRSNMIAGTGPMPDERQRKAILDAIA